MPSLLPLSRLPAAASDATALVAHYACFAQRTRGLLDVIAGSNVEPVADGGSHVPLSLAPSRRRGLSPPPSCPGRCRSRRW